MLTDIPRLRVNQKEAAKLLSVSPRTVAAIPTDVLPRIYIGNSLGYSVATIAKLLRRLESGEVSIGKVNH